MLRNATSAFAIACGAAFLLALAVGGTILDGEPNGTGPHVMEVDLAPTLAPQPSGEVLSCAGLDLKGEIPLRARLMPGPGSQVAEAFGVSATKELVITWAPGYRARFDPGFSKVIGPDGGVFAVAGENINQGLRWHGHVVCFSLRDDLPSGIGISIWPESLVIPTQAE